jgi:hypothetical protein
VEAWWFTSQQKKRARVIQKSRSAHCFFYIRGMVHHEFVPWGQTVNAAFYVEILKRLREHVRCVRSELWAEKNWILHHDNAPSHSALIVHFSPKMTIPWITLSIRPI